jgi:hypothetical protein
MKIRLKTIHLIALTLLLAACDGDWNTATKLSSPNFCDVYPTDPECTGINPGSGQPTALYTTSSGSDGVIRMAHTNPNNPDFGEGYAKINFKNNSNQNLNGSFSVDQGSNNMPITKLEICTRANDAAITCMGAPATQINVSVGPQTTGYFFLKVEADGTIPFVPVVNAVYARFSANGNGQNQEIKIPVTND